MPKRKKPLKVNPKPTKRAHPNPDEHLEVSSTSSSSETVSIDSLGPSSPKKRARSPEQLSTEERPLKQRRVDTSQRPRFFAQPSTTVNPDTAVASEANEDITNEPLWPGQPTCPINRNASGWAPTGLMILVLINKVQGIVDKVRGKKALSNDDFARLKKLADDSVYIVTLPNGGFEVVKQRDKQYISIASDEPYGVEKSDRSVRTASFTQEGPFSLILNSGKLEPITLGSDGIFYQSSEGVAPRR